MDDLTITKVADTLHASFSRTTGYKGILVGLFYL